MTTKRAKKSSQGSKRPGDEDMVRTALGRLIHALVGEETPDTTRLEMVEDALQLAHIALGSSGTDQEKLYDALEVLAAQVLVDGLQRGGDTVARLKIVCEHGDEAASIVITTNPAVSLRLAAAVEDRPLFATQPTPTLDS